VGTRQYASPSAFASRFRYNAVQKRRAPPTAGRVEVQDRVLSRVPLFAELPPERVHELAQSVRRRTYHRGETIFHKGDPGSGLYIIAGGQVKIVLPSEMGEEAMLAVLEAGEFFG